MTGIENKIFQSAPAVTAAKPSGKKAELAAVAEQFEALFLNQLIQQSRQTKLAEDIFASSAADTYQQMLDTEYAKNMSGRVNLGIAEALVRQFGKHEG